MSALAAGDLDVRLAVYRHFEETGRAPDAEDIAAATALAADDVIPALHRLQAAHALALAPGSDNLWMAHPFSAVPTDFVVRTDRGSWWANCAWDAFGLAGLVGPGGRIDTHCADCGEAVTLTVDADSVTPDHGVVHLAVPPRRFWENVGFT